MACPGGFLRLSPPPSAKLAIPLFGDCQILRTLKPYRRVGTI